MSDKTISLNATALSGTGVRAAREVHANLHAPILVEQAVKRDEGRLSVDGALIVSTGVHTGRSVQDKFIVDEPETSADIWWGKINQKLSTAHFERIARDVRDHLGQQQLFTQDLFAGAATEHRVRVRLVTTGAWHALFARNMFIRPTAEELAGFEPDYVILHAPHFQADAESCGLRSGTAVALSFAQGLVVIVGTEYAGEIKKSIFGVMNYLLPGKRVLPMHGSANIGADGDTAIFFGLSGTGKTTLSSDPERALIGDDEHAWTDSGVFNFEGGCYAKVINLSQEAEPEIWDATHRFGTVLENVVADANGRLDLGDSSLTENTRSCYPLPYIRNIKADGCGGVPRHVVMLTADAFGVLPPIARLTPAQAMYHFLSGYTAKVAGTEKGMGREPQATFSTCFGAPFLPRPPNVYGELLLERLERTGATCWLINTGWTGGAYGTGKRISITHTRALLQAALGGQLDTFRIDPTFGLSVPTHVPGVPDEILDPARSWPDAAAYSAQAHKLIEAFEANFAAFAEHVSAAVRAAGPRGHAVADAA